MTTILVAADAAWVRNLVRSAFTAPGQTVIETARGQAVRDLVDQEEPELVVLDLQIANMGGVAVALDLRLEEAAGRLPGVPIILLLDREADRFIAQRADVDVALVKPVDAGQLRKVGLELLEAQVAADA